MRVLYKEKRPKYDLNVHWAWIRFHQGDFEFALKHGEGWLRGEAKLKLGQVDVAIVNCTIC